MCAAATMSRCCSSADSANSTSSEDIEDEDMEVAAVRGSLARLQPLPDQQRSNAIDKVAVSGSSAVTVASQVFNVYNLTHRASGSADPTSTAGQTRAPAPESLPLPAALLPLRFPRTGDVTTRASPQDDGGAAGIPAPHGTAWNMRTRFKSACRGWTAFLSLAVAMVCAFFLSYYLWHQSHGMDMGIVAEASLDSQEGVSEDNCTSGNLLVLVVVIAYAVNNRIPGQNSHRVRSRATKRKNCVKNVTKDYVKCFPDLQEKHVYENRRFPRTSSQCETTFHIYYVDDEREGLVSAFYLHTLLWTMEFKKIEKLNKDIAEGNQRHWRYKGRHRRANEIIG